MRIMVTGAQGFIGRSLVAELLAHEYEVVGVGRSAEEPEYFTHRVSWSGEELRAPLPAALRNQLETHRYRYLAVDLTATQSLETLFSQEHFDVIIHLAGALRDSAFDDLVRSNILATHSLLDSCARVQPDAKIVISSSGSVYGAVPPDRLPVRSEDPTGVQPVDLYSVTKHTAENLAWVAARQHQLQISIGRVFAVVGPGQEERHLCGYLARQFAERQAGVSSAPISIGPLNTTRDFIDVRDVAKALALIAFHDRPPSLLNIASGDERLTSDVFDVLKKYTRDSSELTPTKRGRSLELGRNFADITPLQQLGFVPGFSFEQSLKDTLTYYQDEVATLSHD